MGTMVIYWILGVILGWCCAVEYPGDLKRGLALLGRSVIIAALTALCVLNHRGG